MEEWRWCNVALTQSLVLVALVVKRVKLVAIEDGTDLFLQKFQRIKNSIMWPIMSKSRPCFKPNHKVLDTTKYSLEATSAIVNFKYQFKAVRTTD